MSVYPPVRALLEAAVRNNAEWCHDVATAHGLPGRFEPGLWIHPEPMPPFYPNAITLPHPSVVGQQARIARLVAGTDRLQSVKDSFCCLELEPLGLNVLFTAEWIFRPPQAHRREPKMHCRRLVGDAELRRWELAWGQTPPGVGRIFPPALLANPDVAIIAVEAGERIIGGCIGRTAHGVVGWSNAFGSQPDACLAALADEFPGLPVAGYEREAALRDAKSLGFTTIGQLRVWTSLADPAVAEN